MADLTPFTFRPGKSILHRLDVRYKFVFLSLVSLSMAAAHLPAGFFYLVVLIVLYKKAGINLSAVLNSIKPFLVLLFFVFAARAFSVEGDILFSFSSISVSEQGIHEGSQVALRFFLVMLTGLLFSSTTRPSSVKSAVQWFLKPVPFIPEKRVGVMISLALCFLPVILKQAREISDAQKARCANLQKNPVKRMIRLVLPLLKKIFISADNLILAMESRCYSDDRTDPEFSPSGKEIHFLLGSLVVCLTLICL